MNGDENLIGKMLGMRYLILEEIGSGGMAVVYKAKCRMLNRFVAVKVLKSEFKNDSEIVAKFKAESQAAASLSHQNIVSVYDVGEEGDISYIVMEYVEGVTLKEYIKSKGMIPWREACGLAKQICDAIETAHRNNIIHNDIKPHNILITSDNVAKVTDFGIARAVSGVSSDTMVVSRSAIGSVYYMSPEQDKGRFTDARSDIYSLGIVFYEMLTGKVPFDGDNHVMVSLKKLEEEPTDVRIYNPDIPERVSMVVMKAIARESHARYQTAYEMSRELVRVTSKNYDSYAEEETDNSELSDTRKVKPFDDKIIRNELLKGTGRHTQKHTGNGGINKTDAGNKKAVKKKEDKMSVVLAVITAVVVVAIAFGTYVFMTGGKKEIIVPSLIGLTVEEAQEKIKDKDLVIEEPVLTQSDEKAEAGKIILQNPGANASAKAGTKITVTVSTGPEAKAGNIEVPGVDKLSYSAAVQALNDKKLKAVKIEEESDSINEGYVIRQNPEKGSMVGEDTIVTLYVSSGAKTKIRVPSVEGMTLEKAKEELKTYGLSAGKITKEESSAADGIVIHQEPGEGAQVQKDSTVDIVVSGGNTSATQTPAATEETKEVVMYQHGSNNNAATQEPTVQSATKAPVKTKQPETKTQAPTAAQQTEHSGSTVNTTASEQKTETQKTKTLTVSFNDTVNETIRVRIEANGKEIYNKQHNKSEGGTQVQVKGSKDAEVKIYFDDKLVSTKTISFD